MDAAQSCAKYNESKVADHEEKKNPIDSFIYLSQHTP
jgi:hypothetical protein